MADEYIRRNDFIQYLEKCKKGAAVTNLVWAAIMAIERDVRDMPAADVAPVVRCKDCKYGDYDSKPDGAEKLICENRERLVTPSCEGERGMEGE